MRTRTPILPLLAGIVVGILAFRYLGTNVWLFLLPSLLILVTVFIGRTYLGLTLLCFELGYAVSFAESPKMPPQAFDNKVTVKGTVIKTSYYDYGQRLVLEPDLIVTPTGTFDVKNCRLMVYVNNFETDINPYDIITFKSTLKKAVYDPDLPGDPDYSNFYYYNNLVGTSFIDAEAITKNGSARSLKAWLFGLRKKAADVLQQSGVEPETAQLLDAILLGEAAELNGNQRDIFADAGLAHILALSGTHVAVISAFVFVLFIPFRLLGWRTTVYLSATIFLWFYALLTGMSPSVTRSVIMMTVLFLAQITSRRGNSFNSLCFAAFIILLFDPASLFSPSFQLSFCAVLTVLLFFSTDINLNFQRKWINKLMIAVSISVAALLGTAMLSAYYFHKFPVYSVLANLPMALLLPLFIVVGLIILLLGLCGIKLTVLAWIADVINNCMDTTASFFSGLPHSTVDNIYFEAVTFIPFVIFVILLVLALQKRDRFYGTASALFLLATVLMIIPFDRTTRTVNLYITGDTHGTDILLEAPEGIHVATTRINELPDNTLARMNRTHPDFIHRRGQASFRTLDEESQIDNVAVQGRLLNVNGKIFAIFRDKDDLSRPLQVDKVDYGIITQNCTPSADMVNQLLELGVDTVLIPREINRLTESKLKETLTSKNIPFYSLRDRKFWASY